MSVVYKYIMTIVLCASALSAQSQSVLDSITAIVVAGNPQLKATKDKYVVDSISYGRAVLLDDPQIDFEYNFGRGSLGDKWALGISQSFEWPGIYSARTKAANARVMESWQEYLASLAEVTLQVRLLAIDIIGLNRRIEVQENVCDNLEELSRLYKLAFDGRQISILDINKLRIELINSRQSLEGLKAERAKSIEAMQALAGENPIDHEAISKLIVYPDEELLPIDNYIYSYRNEDPKIVACTLSRTAGEAEEREASLSWAPKFEIGYQYSYELGDRFNGVTAGVSIPLFSSKRRKAQARAQTSAISSSLLTLQSENESFVRQLYGEAISLKQQMTLYGEVLDDDSCTDLLIQALDGGQISLLTYLQELNYFIHARINYLSLENQYHRALVTLGKFYNY